MLLVDPKRVVPWVPKVPAPVRGVDEPEASFEERKRKALDENGRLLAAGLVFQIGIIPAPTWARILDLEMGSPAAVGTLDLMLVRGGLRGWAATNGTAAPAFTAHPDGTPTDDTLTMVSVDVRPHLARAILDLNRAGDADLGKS